MKRRVLSLVIAGLMVCTLFALPVLAEDKQLTDQAQSGNTEVDANIADSAGEVAYIVTIPEKIDFGKLACPDTDTDLPIEKEFEVKCTKKQGVSYIDVSVCNDGSTAGETGQKFYLENKTNTSCTFKPEYDLYVGTEKINIATAMPTNGFKYVTFSQEGQKVDGKVELNQKQLFPFKDDLASIIGTYTGNMVFYIAAR